MISFETLDARGYKYSYQGGVCKVFKEAIVVLKGDMSRSLYKLVGNVEMDGIAREIPIDD